MKQYILQAGLTWIVRNDEAVALAGVEPLYAPADPHGLFVRIHTIKVVTRHPAPLDRPKNPQGGSQSITLFSQEQ